MKKIVIKTLTFSVLFAFFCLFTGGIDILFSDYLPQYMQKESSSRNFQFRVLPVKRSKNCEYRGIHICDSSYFKHMEKYLVFESKSYHSPKKRIFVEPEQFDSITSILSKLKESEDIKDLYCQFYSAQTIIEMASSKVLYDGFYFSPRISDIDFREKIIPLLKKFMNKEQINSILEFYEDEILRIKETKPVETNEK